MYQQLHVRYRVICLYHDMCLFLLIYLFLYFLLFYPMLSTFWIVIFLWWVVRRAMETNIYSRSRLCTVNCWSTASNYHATSLYNLFTYIWNNSQRWVTETIRIRGRHNPRTSNKWPKVKGQSWVYMRTVPQSPEWCHGLDLKKGIKHISPS